MISWNDSALGLGKIFHEELCKKNSKKNKYVAKNIFSYSNLVLYVFSIRVCIFVITHRS